MANEAAESLRKSIDSGRPDTIKVAVSQQLPHNISIFPEVLSNSPQDENTVEEIKILAEYFRRLIGELGSQGDFAIDLIREIARMTAKLIEFPELSSNPDTNTALKEPLGIIYVRGIYRAKQGETMEQKEKAKKALLELLQYMRGTKNADNPFVSKFYTEVADELENLVRRAKRG